MIHLLTFGVIYLIHYKQINVRCDEKIEASGIFKIIEYFDFEKLDTLFGGFNLLTGFVTAIFDLEGNILSKSGIIKGEQIVNLFSGQFFFLKNQQWIFFKSK